MAFLEGFPFWMAAFFLVCSCGCDGEASSRDYCQPSACDANPQNRSSVVAKFCAEAKLTLSDRCCQNGSEIVALDLTRCNLDDTAILANPVYHKSSLLDLSGNPFLIASEDDFDGFTLLQKLLLDNEENVTCPGGKNSWNTTNGGDEETLICMDQLDSCFVTAFECPNPVDDSASCQSRGPGLSNRYCVCNEGYHGYKCMRKGSFPKVTFAAGLGSVTVGVAGFLWVTNRRLVL